MSDLTQPRPCGHYFPWWGVVPPSYCPICGAWIGPIYTGPPCPQPQLPIYPTITYSDSTGAES
jgi:hypothetical protein